MRFSLAAAFLILCLAASQTGQAEQGAFTVPQVGASLPAPIPTPYDTQADAHAQVDAAFARARATGHLVMLDFGGNWCPDCRILAGVLAQPEVEAWRKQHYETVLVDIGRRDRHLDIPARWKVKIEGVPTVLIITPDGRLLNAGNVYALSDARSMSQQAIVDLMASWHAKS